MIGVLKQKTFIYTVGGTTIALEKATLVEKANNALYFNEYPELVITKQDDAYIAHYYDTPQRVVFPNGGSPPYPLSLL
jgi:hypothetical protein